MRAAARDMPVGSSSAQTLLASANLRKLRAQAAEGEDPALDVERMRAAASAMPAGSGVAQILLASATLREGRAVLAAGGNVDQAADRALVSVRRRRRSPCCGEWSRGPTRA